MATYSRLGTFIVGGDLTADPIGKIHRGLTITGSRFDRHKLLRTFSDELVEAGIASRMEEAGRTAAQLAGTRGFGSAYHFIGGKVPHVSCDYVGGRSLHQLIQKARQEQIPLGVDHALSVLQGLSQSLTVLHSKGFTHGALSPHSVWVSFEGATQIIDAPMGAALQALLPKCPNMARLLEAYRPSQGANAPQQDFYALGAILYELLTLESLPAKAQVAAAIQDATLKAAQEDAPVPPELQALLRRLLLVDAPFESASAFVSELERVLYDGDYSPTTFNMAFFMHTLFREENELDTIAMKADTVADYTPLMDAVASARGIEGLDTQKYARWAMIGGGVLVVLVGALLYTSWSKNRENSELVNRIAQMENQFKTSMDRMQQLEAKGQALKAQEATLTEKAQKGDKKAAEDLKKIQDERKATEAQTAQAKQEVQMAQQNIQTLKPPTAVAPKQAPAAAPFAPATTQLTNQAPVQPAPQTATPQPIPQQPAAQPQITPPQPAAPAAASVTEVAPELTAGASIGGHMSLKAKQMIKNYRGRTFDMRVRVFVDANGNAQRVQMEKSSGVDWGLDDAAESAARASKFKPATRNGQPVAGWIVVPFAVRGDK